MKVQVKVLDPRAAVPQRGTPMSAGYDLIAAIDHPVKICKGEAATLIPTGVAIFIADASVMGLILPRSGLGHKHGLVLGNTAGVIDGDYQNQWFVSAWNRGQQDEIVINPGDRIAQVVFVPVLHPSFDVVFEFSKATVRGQGGFGSTGTTLKEGVQVKPKTFEAAERASSNVIYPYGSLGESVDAGYSSSDCGHSSDSGSSCGCD